MAIITLIIILMKDIKLQTIVVDFLPKSVGKSIFIYFIFMSIEFNYTVYSILFLH